MTAQPQSSLARRESVALNLNRLGIALDGLSLAAWHPDRNVTEGLPSRTDPNIVDPLLEQFMSDAGSDMWHTKNQSHVLSS
jgi:hypothetical protein